MDEKAARDAVDKLHTAEIDVASSDAVLEKWDRALNENRQIVRRNGFGEALTRIMRAPVRKAS